MTIKSFRFAAACLVSFLPAGTMLLASPVENVDEHFRLVDRNRDGVASGDEIRGTLFARYDTNADGAVTAAEFAYGRAFDKKFADTAKDPQQAWVVLDWNQDGYLSGTELDGKWDALDFDRDGKVQKHEFITGRTAPAVAPGPGTAPAPVAPAPAAPPATAYIPPPASAPGTTPAPVAPPATAYIPPPAAGGDEAAAPKSLWGASLATAQKSDLFTFFNLARVGQGIPLEAGTQWVFQPKQGPFRELVMVKLTESRDKRIVAAELLLAASFVTDPKTDVFARDIAKSFVAQLTPAAHAAATRDLVNELWHGAPNQVRVGGGAAPKLPDPPTAGYQAYLGKRENYEQTLGDAKLIIISAPAADEWLLISFQPAVEAGN